MSQNELFISTDVETDGPIPGPHSMLSLGSAAFTPEGQLLSEFSVNLFELEDASAHPQTKEWWLKNPEAWEETRKNCVHPLEAMRSYSAWISTLPGTPIFVAYPASFDFMFVCWYLIKFTGKNPFSHSALDIRSYFMGAKKTSYSSSSMKNYPSEWIPNNEKPHVALSDAIQQGIIFSKMHSWNIK